MYWTIALFLSSPLISGHKIVFKGIPWLPSYFDANKTGMYCIVRESKTPPPAYASNNIGGIDNNTTTAGILLPTSWDCDAYGVSRGLTNSMPEFSTLFDPPPSPYPPVSNITYVRIIYWAFKSQCTAMISFSLLTILLEN